MYDFSNWLCGCFVCMVVFPILMDRDKVVWWKCWLVVGFFAFLIVLIVVYNDFLVWI